MNPDTRPFANGADPETRWQAQLTNLAGALPYPPTPNLAAAWHDPSRAQLAARPARSPRLARGLAWSLATIVLVLAALLAILATGAGLLEFLQIGSVRIFFVPSATPSPVPTSTPSLAA
ncbi:MAG: hypothetical protein ABI847_11645, partial [Anaerolineales bacterium]